MSRYSQANTNESGILYLVNDHQDRRFVRRPKPSRTFAPLPDDFDEATTRPPTEWNPRSSWTHATTTPMPDDFDAMTYIARSGAPMDIRERNNDFEVQDHRPLESTRRSHSFASGPSGWSSVAAYNRLGSTPDDMAMELGEYGEYGDYTKEMQQVFPSSKGFEVSVSKVSSKHRRPSGPGMASHSVRRRPQNWKEKTAGRGGPRPGVEYDFVRDKIMEDSPEKTVVISTWRERVAEETKAEDMSVYYLSPRDYESQEEEFRAAQNDRASTQSRALSMVQTGSQTSHWSPSRERANGRRRLESIQSSTQTEERRSMSPVIKPSAASAPWTSTPQKQADPCARPQTSSSPRPSLQPSLNERRLSPSYAPIRTIESDAYEDALKMPHTPPFIPTRSGSTISSIRSRATTVFQEILASCYPPLSHIGNTLVGLGINSEEHLRAVARMSEDVRDREVKEAALKKGVTVMEWALLLDKMQSL